MTAEIVDVGVAVHVPLSWPFGAIDIDAVGPSIPGIMGDPARQQRPSLRYHGLGPCRVLNVSGDDMGVRLHSGIRSYDD